MTGSLDLTGFGFTPTESLVYEVLVRSGPGTGYAIARSAGLARANAYSALEGLVQKGGARVEEGRPKRYRPEPPATLVARIVEHQGHSLDTLSRVLAEISIPPTPTLVELTSSRGALQLLFHEIARAQSRIGLILPADGFTSLIPALRKAAGASVALELGSPTTVELAFSPVTIVAGLPNWPGELVLFAVDGRGAVIGAKRAGDSLTGHWGTDPVFVATAEALIRMARGGG